MVVYRSLVLFLLFEIVFGDVDVIVNPGKRCVATSTQVGPCHICICTTSGVFHCRGVKCDYKAAAASVVKKQCDPLRTYRQDTIICSCDEFGQWRSSKCKENFYHMKPKFNHHRIKIRTDIACTPGQFYIAGCNICLCDSSKFLNLGSCSSRPCVYKYKVDSCRQGDVLRTTNEICMCSDIGYFIDRLCHKIEDEVVQEVNADDLDRIVAIGSYWDVLREDACKPYYLYTIDCARCQCSYNSILKCDVEHCKRPKPIYNEEDDLLRSHGMRQRFDSFPELQSQHSECEPGVKYRHKCNSCFCNDNREPLCTTMLCLEDFKLTIQDLKQRST